MAFTTPPVKATTDTISAVDWADSIRGNLIDLDARATDNSFKGCVLRRTTNQSTANGVSEFVVWTSEIIDQGGWFAPSSAAITVPTGILPSGCTTLLIQVTVQLYWEANATGTRRIYIELNGSEYCSSYPASPGAVLLPVGMTSPDIPVVPGDVIKILVAQTSGGALNIAGASQAAFVTVRRVGAF